MRPYLKNILMIVGSTVGAGIFTLPFVLKRGGSVPFVLLLILLAIISMRMNIFYAAIVARLKGNHQFPGHVGLVLGTGWGRISALLLLFSTAGALIAFASIGGTFLSQAFPISKQSGGMIFYTVTTFVLLFAGKKLEAFEDIMTVVKAVMMLIIVIACIKGNVFSGFSLAAFGSEPLAAYGALLFALNGFSIIPELHKGKSVGPAISHAQVAISLLYAAFAFATVSFVSFETYSFASRGLQIFFNITGAVAVFSPYMLLAQVGKDILVHDLGQKEKASLGAMAFIAFPAILFGFDNFLGIIGLTGGVFIGGMGILICTMYSRLFPGKHRFEAILAGLILLLGVFGELFTFFS